MKDYVSVKTHVVAVGIDGPETEQQILRDTESMIKESIMDQLQLKRNNMYIDSRIGKQRNLQIKDMNDKTIHVHQYEIGINSENSYDGEKIQSIVSKKLRNTGFNPTDVRHRRVEEKIVPKRVMEN